MLLLAGRAIVTVRDADISDFRCFYAAADLVRRGLDPYDAGQWVAATRADPLRLPPCPSTTFAYPLWTAMAMVPLTALPIQTATGLWEIVLFACAAGAVALLARTWTVAGGARVLLVLVLWSQPMFSAIANAQLGPVVLLGVAGSAFALRRARERLAGAAWLLLLLKPNMVVLVVAGLPAAVRARSFLVASLGGALAIVALSVALVPTWPLDLLRVITGEQLLVDRDLSTLWSLAAVLGLPPSVGIVASAAALLAFCLAVPWPAFDRPTTVAALTAASFVITPYTRAHDEIVLAICWAAVLGVAASSARRSLAYATAGVALALPWSLTALSLAGLPLAWYSLIPLATAALLAYALRLR